MSRVELKGKGDPIPTIAIPDPNISDELPPQIILMEESGEFHKQDWIGLGYTHYEVWCVGGAGGVGGTEANQVVFTYTQEEVVMPPDVWTLWLERVRVEDWSPTNGWDHQYSYGPNEFRTAVQQEILTNPLHKITKRTYTGASLKINNPLLGGAGGGGGLHKIGGVLDELPDVVNVEVGQAGSQGISGQTKVDGVWTPVPDEVVYRFDTSGQGPGNPPIGSPDHRLYELYNYFMDYAYSYPEPRASFSMPPQPGGDGGASIFNEGEGQASGGKGGQALVYWLDGVLMMGGSGGAGGSGGQSEAGGGALGGTNDKDAPAGTWDGTIGKGGGGGRSGIPDPPPPHGPGVIYG